MNIKRRDFLAVGSLALAAAGLPRMAHGAEGCGAGPFKTVLKKALIRKRLTPEVVKVLKDNGYRQYEISNFARRGKHSRHNMKYWTGLEYIGFGPNAASDFAGKYFTMVGDLRSYIDGIFSGGQVIADVMEIPVRERAGDYLMLRLRTVNGISAQEYERQYLLPFAPLEEELERCAERGCAVLENGRWHLTPKGMMISNSIISELQLIQERSIPLNKRRM
jgi:oxygen-independent coproporphyrinogen-3 oxidase